MTTLWVASFLLVGAVCGLNLLLTLGVIRRLREHAQQLAAVSDGGLGVPSQLMLGTGERAGPFEAITTDGERVSRELLAGQTLVGFFSPHCGACEEKLPEFVARAAAFAGGRERVLAVLTGSWTEVEAQCERLVPVARVVVEPLEGPISSALQVRGWPVFGMLDADGTVIAGELDLERVGAVPATLA